ncbi:MAG: helix-turn-helix transcriptional regulator [Myxococcota bacterium]
MSNTFGDIIYRRRKALAMTQEALADKVGVKPTYIGYLERGKRHASPRIAGALADVLGLNRSYLFLASNPVVRDFLNINDETYELSERPLPQALIDLRDDGELRRLHNITDEEVHMLVRLAFLGEPRDRFDYVLLLSVIRRIFEGR